MTLHVEIPNPKVLERPAHRQFTAEYKKRTLEQYESAVKGERGALLRKEGLYSSHIDSWRKQRDAGSLDGNMTKRGRKPTPKNPLAAEVEALKRKLATAEKKLAQARTIIEVQKKLSEELGLTLVTSESDESE